MPGPFIILLVDEEKTKMARQKETKGSRTFPVAVMLTLAGGYLDAYTYSARGKVFANAQTGNIVKLGISAANRDFARCGELMWPILAFTVGVLLSMIIETYMKRKNVPFIRRSVLIIEIVMLLASMFLPQDAAGNMIANSMISLICAMQMETFKMFIGQPITTTVSTGNLRKLVEFMYQGILEHDKEKRATAVIYLIVVLAFIAGALIGTLITNTYQLYSAVVPAVLLMFGFLEISRIYYLNN